MLDVDRCIYLSSIVLRLYIPRERCKRGWGHHPLPPQHPTPYTPPPYTPKPLHPFYPTSFTLPNTLHPTTLPVYTPTPLSPYIFYPTLHSTPLFTLFLKPYTPAPLPYNRYNQSKPLPLHPFFTLFFYLISKLSKIKVHNSTTVSSKYVSCRPIM